MSSFETIQDYEISIAAGQELKLPGGNLFMVYSLSGVDKLAATFIAGNGMQSARANIRANFSWGNGQGAENGGLLFTSVTLKNEGASTATAVIYMAHQEVTANVFSGAVNVSTLPAGENATTPLLVSQVPAPVASRERFFVSYQAQTSASDWLGMCIRAEAGKTIWLDHVLVSKVAGEFMGVGFDQVSAATLTTETGWTTGPSETSFSGETLTGLVNTQQKTNITTGWATTPNYVWRGANIDRIEAGAFLDETLYTGISVKNDQGSNQTLTITAVCEVINQ